LIPVKVREKPPANNLLDHAMNHLKLKNDAALSKVLDMTPPQISKMRSAKIGVGGLTLIRIHEVTGTSISDLKKLAKLPPARPYVPPPSDLKTASPTVANE